jgi:hypothetical protein
VAGASFHGLELAEPPIPESTKFVIRCLGRQLTGPRFRRQSLTPQHFLYFLPLPHGHGSFRPTFG